MILGIVQSNGEYGYFKIVLIFKFSIVYLVGDIDFQKYCRTLWGGLWSVLKGDKVNEIDILTPVLIH